MNTLIKWGLAICSNVLVSFFTNASTLTIAAAADLRFAFAELKREFESEQANHDDHISLQIIYGSSGKISNQIRQGAPFDIFFSADQRFTKALFQEQLTTDAGTLYAKGRLVLWSAKHNLQNLQLEELRDAKFKKIAIAEPTHAPYGERARQILIASGIWPEVRSKMVFGENIAQTAQFAQSGAADVAFIALSLIKNPQLTNPNNYQLLDANLHQPLNQAYAVTKLGAGKPQSSKFTAFMNSAQAKQILQKYGFELPQQTTGNKQ
jgi:molybdate transport system substrate-binding protein